MKLKSVRQRKERAGFFLGKITVKKVVIHHAYLRRMFYGRPAGENSSTMIERSSKEGTCFVTKRAKKSREKDNY